MKSEEEEARGGKDVGFCWERLKWMFGGPAAPLWGRKEADDDPATAG